MTIIKQTIIDRIEILENNILQIRQANQIIENGIKIGETFDRWLKAPGDDISDQDKKVQSVANLLWTPEVISNYQSLILAEEAKYKNNAE